MEMQEDNLSKAAGSNPGVRKGFFHSNPP